MGFLGLFGPPNVEKLAARRDVEGLIKALGYQKDSDVRWRAADALGKLGDARAVGPLIASLGDVDLDALRGGYRDVSKKAVEALVRIGAAAVEPLIFGLGDDNHHVRGGAAEALGLIGDARAMEPLMARLGDNGLTLDGYVGQVAARALGKIGAVAVEPLIARLGDKDRYVRGRAAEALEKCGWKPSADRDGAAYWMALDRYDECLNLGAVAVESLIARLGDEDYGVRMSTAEALGKIGDSRAVEPLIARLGDTDWDSRKRVAEALGKCGWRPTADADGAAYWIALGRFDECLPLGDVAVEPLIATLGLLDIVGRHWHERIAAAEALGTIGDARAVKPLIAMLGDRNWSVRRAAAEALANCGWKPSADEDGVAYLIALDHFYQCLSLGAVAVEPLIARLTDWRLETRREAAGALVALHASSTLSPDAKRRILASRAQIIEKHTDGTTSSDCSEHYDSGIDVPFPL